MRSGRKIAMPVAGLLAMLLCSSLACSDRGDGEATRRPVVSQRPAAEQPSTASPSDAPAKETKATEAGASGGNAVAGPDLHFDSARSEYRPRAKRSMRDQDASLELLLRSTPPGAVAAIDGKSLGTTPILWRGRATGKPHEFTFVLPGYAMARYRFTPVQSGIVHGTLKRQTTPSPDAGPAAIGAGR